MKRIARIDLLSAVSPPQVDVAEEGAPSRFEKVSLLDTRVEGLSLCAASFRAADLRRAVFVECDLSEADFSDACGLLPSSFPGCNLRGARLPDGLGFEAPLATVQGAVSYARSLFLLIVAASLYCLLTVGATTDLDLLVNTASMPLPIIETPVPIGAFYALAPALLLASAVWMHAYLQRVWTTLAHLPARFPDGLPLSDRIDQWIPLSVGAGGLARRAATFGQLESMLSSVALWLVVPGVMLAMWARYLPLHDLRVSGWQAATIALGLASSAVFAIRARHTFARKPFARPQLVWELGWGGAVAALAAAALLPITLAVVGTASPDGVFGTAAPRLVKLAEKIGLPDRLVLSKADVAARPAGWTGGLGGAELAEALAEVNRVELSERRLDRAKADGAFFARARLDDAKLRELWAPSAVFVQASLIGADLVGATLTKADFRDADLSGADLSGAQLLWANLRGACFAGASLKDADLRNADLRGADLSGTYPPITSDQLARSICNGETSLPIGLSSTNCLLDNEASLADTSFVPAGC